MLRILRTFNQRAARASFNTWRELWAHAREIKRFVAGLLCNSPRDRFERWCAYTLRLRKGRQLARPPP